MSGREYGRIVERKSLPMFSHTWIIRTLDRIFAQKGSQLSRDKRLSQINKDFWWIPEPAP